MKTFNIGGVHPDDSKLNADAPMQELPIPKQVCVMVSQHLGAPSQPIVKKGDKVKVGTVLTSNDAFLSAVVHSPVSGTVNKIADVVDASLYPKPAIFIDVEGDEWEESIDRSPEIKREINLDGPAIIQKIKEMGIVGMGGACFPTHVKLMPPKDAKAEYLLLNGVECEPYLTCDYRLMLDHAEEIMIGAQILMKALNVPQAIVGIEANKPKAIAHMSEMAKKFPGISVQALKMKYPQGAETCCSFRQIAYQRGMRGGQCSHLLRGVPSRAEEHAACTENRHGDRSQCSPAYQLPGPPRDSGVRFPRSHRRRTGRYRQSDFRRPHDGQGLSQYRSQLRERNVGHPGIARKASPPQHGISLHPLRQMRGSLPDGVGTLSDCLHQPGQSFRLDGKSQSDGLHRMRLLPFHLPVQSSAIGCHQVRQVHRWQNHPCKKRKELRTFRI